MSSRLVSFWAALLWSVLALAVLAGCSRGAEDIDPVQIRIERKGLARDFRVTWTTPSPARAIVFARGSSFRAANWMPAIGGQRIEKRAGREILWSPEATREFAVSFPAQAINVSGDYSPVTSFSDDGAVLYTGYLDVSPVECLEKCSEEDVTSRAVRAPSRLVLRAGPGERAIIDESTSAFEVAKAPPEGLFVYFGRQQVHRGRGYRVVVDPKLPSWVFQEIERYLPQILKLDETRLERELPAQPMLFVPYREQGHRKTASQSGAVVGYQMLLALQGQSWLKKEAAGREELLQLLAHESFHFWNATLFRSVDRPGSRWLHEGSAEYFSIRALREIGVISADRERELESEALNRCLVGLLDRDLPSSDRSLRNHYECGAAVGALVERGLIDAGSDGWRLWRAVFEKAARNEGTYDADSYFQVVAAETRGERLVDSLRRFTVGDTGVSHDRYFLSEFQSHGVTHTSNEDSYPLWYRKLMAEKTLSALIEQDCAGTSDLVLGPDQVHLLGGDWCRTVRGSTAIDRIAHFKIWHDGVAAYDYVAHSCGMRPLIELSKSNAPTSLYLRCPALPARPRFLMFTAKPQ